MATDRPGKTLQETEILYQKATRAEVDRSYDQAFELYISAAQSYLQHVRNAVHERDRKKYKLDAHKCLERAERIKAAKRDLAPLVRNPFSEEEQLYVLERSSHIHSLRFPIWRAGVTSLSPEVEQIYKDPDGQPALAPSATEMLPSWRRPHDIVPEITMASPALLPDEIIQNMITDCSVCTSIAVCLQHHHRFDSKVGFTCMFPQDSTGLPKMASDGRYEFRLLINGAHRKIVIDDRLPFRSDGTPIFVSTMPKFDLWPSLIEKAYMKLLGGYDFPGSNSSVDIHALTGWIPEHLEIRSAVFESEKAWSRIIQNYAEGRCMVTLGTGQRGFAQLSFGGIQLLPTHSYAVIDVHETDGERWFTVLNPWVGSPPVLDGGKSLDQRVSALELNQRNSMVNVSWSDICTLFDGVYLNWDPSLFKHQLDFHGLWKPKAEKTHSNSVHSHMWFNAETAKAGDEVWVLLTRHIVDKRRENEYIAIHVQQEEVAGDAFSPRQALLKGIYTSSTHILTRYTLTEPVGGVTLVASYDGEYEDVAFTVQAFSSSKLSWKIDIHVPVYSHRMQGLLSSKNAGGNSTYPSFMHNPQYRLRIHPGKTPSSGSKAGSKTTVRLIAEGPRDVPLNVTLVWSRGGRTFDLVQGDILANSGPYSYGVARATASLSAGEYNVIVSAFEPRYRGPFLFFIESSTRIDVEQVPIEGAGMFCKNLRGAWDTSTAGGGPTFGRYAVNPSYEIDVQSATSMKVRLQLTKPSSAIALNVTIFVADADRNLGRQVATSGPYSDTVSGVVTPQMSLVPGKYLLVASTYDPGIHAAFELSIFTKTSDIQIALKR